MWYGRLDGRSGSKIAAAVGELRGKGITPFRLEIRLAGPGPRPWTRVQAHRAHKGLQRAAVQELISQQPGGTEYMQILRRAADRWRIPLLPGRRVDRWLGTLAWLRRQAPPRVVAGMLRTLTNSWITGRRMQQRAATCMMGCDAPDAIEHYACCRHIN